ERGGRLASRRRESSGLLARLALWTETLLDLVPNAIRVQGDVLGQDLRYTARTLRRAPGFALTVVLVAAFGGGATPPTFPTTDPVRVRPLPFPAAERLLKVWSAPEGYSRTEFSPGNYRDWKAMNASLEGMAAFTGQSVNLVGEGEPQRLDGTATTWDLFAVLGTPPALGRVFTPDDDREGAPGTLVISHGLWQSRFGGDPGVLGRKVILDGEPSQIIGVMPPGFLFPTRETQLWKAIRFMEADFAERDDDYVQILARLKPGVSLEQARAEAKVLAARLES